MYKLSDGSLQFPKKIFCSLKFDFILSNSADPDEMPPDAALHLGLHCLPYIATVPD